MIGSAIASIRREYGTGQPLAATEKEDLNAEATEVERVPLNHPLCRWRNASWFERRNQEFTSRSREQQPRFFFSAPLRLCELCVKFLFFARHKEIRIVV